MVRSPDDQHVVLVPLEESPHDLDMRMAWRRDDRDPAPRTALQGALALEDVDA